MMKSPFDGAFSVNGLYLSGAFFYLFQVAGMVRPFVSVGFHTSCGYGNPDQIFCSGFGQSRFDLESMFFTGVHCSAFTPPLIVIGIKGFQNNEHKFSGFCTLKPEIVFQSKSCHAIAIGCDFQQWFGAVIFLEGFIRGLIIHSDGFTAQEFSL